MIRIFKIFVPTSVLALLFSEVLLIFASYLASVYLSPDMDMEVFIQYEDGLTRIAIVTALILAGLYFNDLYTNVRVRSRLLLGQQLCLVVGVAFIVQALLSFAHEDFTLDKSLMVSGSLIVLAVLFGWRLLFSAALKNSLGKRRVLFLGTSPTVFQVASHFHQHPELGMLPIGYLDGVHGSAPPDATLKRLGSVDDLSQVVDETAPEWILIGNRKEVQPWWVREFLELRFGGIETEEIARVYETTFGRVCAREVRPADVLFAGSLSPRTVSERLHTMYTLGFALTLAILAFPLMLLAALLIKITSRGPIFIREMRVGLHDVPFTMYRFRCAEIGPGIPRATPIGKILARFRLQPLPQLFQVLVGQMSLVGPEALRPETTAALSEKIPFYRQRHMVKPGITGWEQVNDNRSSDQVVDALRQLEYDLYYIKNLSPSLDFFILLRSAKTLLLRD